MSVFKIMSLKQLYIITKENVVHCNKLVIGDIYKLIPLEDVPLGYKSIEDGPYEVIGIDDKSVLTIPGSRDSFDTLVIKL